MELIGHFAIALPRQTVWDGLNDVAILQEAIPGCTLLEWTSENSLEGEITTKVGPVKAKFKGSIELQDLNPPEHYTLVGQGKGGIAGFAKGQAHIRLEETEDGIVLYYEVGATVGGKLAQIGARLVKGTAQKLADDFFSELAEIIKDRNSNG